MTWITEFSPALLSADIDYPTSDGRPMGETDLHRNILTAEASIAVLRPGN